MNRNGSAVVCAIGAERLGQVGHLVSAPTVARLLRKLGYSLRVNVKKREGSRAHPERQQQVAYLEKQKDTFGTAGLPIMSVDTKKKELIGNFKNAGQTWCHHPEEVSVHDFPSDALARAVPYGIYDVSRKRGSVYVGISADTPEFAVAAIARWWQEEERLNYPQANQLLILADAGGSNGCRARSFKLYLQERVSDRYGLVNGRLI